MTPNWPETPDDRVDPALAPLIEAGEGESEGFDVAEADLIEHSQHSDYHSTQPIMFDAIDDGDEVDDETYGEPDTEVDPDE
jgi:hypothetical protein